MARLLSSFNHTWLRLPITFVFSFAFFVAFGGSALAAPPSTIRETTTAVSFYASDCFLEPDGSQVCTGVYASVTSHGSSWEVSFYKWVDAYPLDGAPTHVFESGWTSVDPGSFEIDTKKLTAAELSPVTMTVDTYTCDGFDCIESSRTSTISGAWSSVGNLMRFNEKFSMHDGQCKTMYLGKAEAIQASSTLTIDGQTVQGNEAYLAKSRTSFKISSSC